MNHLECNQCDLPHAVLGFCLQEDGEKGSLDEGMESSLALLLDLHVPSKGCMHFLSVEPLSILFSPMESTRP